MSSAGKLRQTRPVVPLGNRSIGLFSPETVLFLATMVIFGYCFLYVSLPFMLHRQAARIANSAAQAQSASEHLPQAKQHDK